MNPLTKKINLVTNKKQKTNHPHIVTYLTILLLVSVLMATTIFAIQTNSTVKAEEYTEIYYVSANGNDTYNGLSEATPFATLEKTAEVINNKGIDHNYLILIMTDLTSTACARYYDNSVTITSLNEIPYTVTRGSGFAGLSDNARSWYNPAMLELGSTNLTETAPKITLTLKNIIFDDAYLHEGSIFRYAPTPYNPNDSGLNHVQDAIVASYAISASIILDQGAELHNFGGMTAIRVTDHATVILNNGSLITDIRPNNDTNTRAVSTSSTNWDANGEAAISITNSYLYMYSGAKITNIANAHAIKFAGTVACFMDGEIAHMIGNKGMDTDPNNGGRGVKSAIYFDRSPTIDHTNPATHISGSAIIGPNAAIHNNAIKCGAISVSRSTSISVEIYGKINNNVGGTGSTGNAAATNGGGLYIVNGGTVYLEDGCEIIGNRLTGLLGYGGAASVQQSGSRLIMNGGTISGNSGSATNPGITVNKGDASFEMNGGIIENGDQALHLYESGSDGTAGKLTLNAGTISGVTVDRGIPFGYSLQRHLFINQDNVTIETGYVSVAGRNVYPLKADFKIGNPNPASYTSIRSNLPKGWSMPTTDSNVIGFWIEKNGRAEYSVLKPTTGTGGTNYNAALNLYFATVQATIATGAIDTSVPLKLYPTTIVRLSSTDHIVVSIPLDAYPNGATVVLVQPTTAYGEINFQGPTTIDYDTNTQQYIIPYTATYAMPPGLRTELITDGHNNTNTAFTFTLSPDSRTIIDISSLTFDSDLFEIAGVPVWNALTEEFIVTLTLKDDWDSMTNLESTFKFNCNMDAVDFEEDTFLSLTGHLEIVGNGKTYFIYGDEAKTLMVMPKGMLCVNKILDGDAVDKTKTFHFTITFSDNGTYNDVANGSTIALKGGESKLITGIPQGTTYKIVELEANQDGYTSYSINASGTISDIPSNALFTNSKYKPSEHVVTVKNSFAGAISGTGTYTEGANVTINAGNRNAYIFSGWTADIASAVFEDNLNATTSFIMPDNDVVATANWVALEYTISYMLNGGVNVAGNPVCYVVSDLPLEIANPYRAGYSFLYWIVRYANGTEQVLLGSIISRGVSGDILLTAYWSPGNTYNIFYELGGGVNPSINPSSYLVEDLPVSITDPSRVGYVFAGWTVTYADGTEAISQLSYSIPVGTVGDVVLRAVWQYAPMPDVYGIFYELEGGVNAPGNPFSYTVEDLPLNIADPTRAGYAFLGWIVKYTNGATTDPVLAFSIPDGTTGDITLTAQWIAGVATRYSVTYNGNGHTGGTVPIDNSSPYLSGSQVTVLGQGGLSRNGYTFLGWATSSNTNTATFTAGSTFTITADTVLYVVWKQTTSTSYYNVTYQPGTHGTFTTQTTNNLVYGAPTPVAPKVTGESGWRFTGWSPIPSTTVTSNAIYVAQWTPEQSTLFTVQFIDWNGTLLKSQAVPYGGNAAAPNDPTRAGYTFTSWDHNYTNVTSNLTITAQYTANSQPPEALQSWALVNLVLSIGGLILAIVLIVYALLHHKQQQKTSQIEKAPKKQKHKHHKFWLVATLVIGIVGVVVFLISEDLSRTMSLVDNWTIINAIVFVVEVVTAVFAFKFYTKKEHNTTIDTTGSLRK